SVQTGSSIPPFSNVPSRPKAWQYPKFGRRKSRLSRVQPFFAVNNFLTGFGSKKFQEVMPKPVSRAGSSLCSQKQHGSKRVFRTATIEPDSSDGIRHPRTCDERNFLHNSLILKRIWQHTQVTVS